MIGAAGADATAARTISFSGLSIVADTIYTVTIGGATFSYKAVGGDTAATVAAGLAAAIDGLRNTLVDLSAHQITLRDGVADDPAKAPLFVNGTSVTDADDATNWRSTTPPAPAPASPPAPPR